MDTILEIHDAGHGCVMKLDFASDVPVFAVPNYQRTASVVAPRTYVAAMVSQRTNIRVMPV